MTYLTDDELDAVHASGLDPFTPYVIDGVSRTQLSVARHYGGCTYGGREYYYIPTTDELVRDDVVKWITARREEAQRAAREADEAQQMEML
jgi:hypothetical protein